MPTPSAEASAREPTGVEPSPTSIAPADGSGRGKLPKLPTRSTPTHSLASARRLWHTRNRELLERVTAGLRRLGPPAACKSAAPIRGRAHAMHVMADHATHGCARFRLAAQYIEAHQ